MSQFIITSEAKEEKDFKEEITWFSEKRALFFSPIIGRKRLYRSGVTNTQKGLKILSYKNKNIAEMICKHVNENYNDDFKVEEIAESVKLKK